MSIEVYVMRDAAGLVKVGHAKCALSRLHYLHDVASADHRPIHIVRGIRIRSDLAYKIERYTQHLLRDRVAIYRNFREWFHTTPGAASRLLNRATASILRADKIYGPKFKSWRKALKLDTGNYWE